MRSILGFLYLIICAPMDSKKKFKITVLHILSSAGIGGGERYVLDLIKYSGESFRHIVAVPYRGPFEQQLRDRGFDYFIVNMERRFSLTALLCLIDYIRSNGVHIIHTHGFRANFYGRLAGMLASVQTVATVHVSLFDYVDTPELVRSFYILLEKVLAFKTSRFLCVSQAMKKDMLRLGIPAQKIVVMPNGVDLDFFYPRSVPDSLKKELGIETEGPVIGTAGRMVPEKGQIYLIGALKYLKDEWKDLKCLFIGEGPSLSKLKKVASESGMDDICIFSGMRKDIELIYPALDLFILPSIREPFGLVLLEAMASGIPVLATDSGGPSEFIESGVNGFLVIPKDSKALAEKITWILSNKEKAGNIAIEGLKLVERHFSVRKTAEKIVEQYLAICGQSYATGRGGAM
jgi:glycosyltransferase involved in cell wall biosynthesis